MDADKIDELTTRYVWVIQNEGEWHRLARKAIDEDNFGKFRSVCGTFINKVEISESEKLKAIEWAFVVLELWKQAGGLPFAALNDPGTLKAEYKKLIYDGADSGTGAPLDVTEFTRRRGESFCVYGAAYTYKDRDTWRMGKFYSGDDLAFLDSAYESGSTMEQIAIHLRRTGIGVCEKMTLRGLLYRGIDGNFYCAKDVPKNAGQTAISNPCGEILLEVAAHTEQAARHLGNVAEQLETMNKEKSMSVIATNPEVVIETRVVVFGQDANSLSDQQLIDAIKRVEGDISKLNEVKTSSKKIASNIALLESNLGKIVEILDAR